MRANRDEPFWRSGEADARRLAWFFAPLPASPDAAAYTGLAHAWGA